MMAAADGFLLRSELKSFLLEVGAASNRGQFCSATEQATASEYVARLEGLPSEAAYAEQLDGAWDLIYSDIEPFRASPFWWQLQQSLDAYRPGAGERVLPAHRLATSVGEIGRVRQRFSAEAQTLTSEVDLRAGFLPGLPLGVRGTVVTKASYVVEEATPMEEGMVEMEEAMEEAMEEVVAVSPPAAPAPAASSGGRIVAEDGTVLFGDEDEDDDDDFDGGDDYFNEYTFIDGLYNGGDEEDEEDQVSSAGQAPPSSLSSSSSTSSTSTSNEPSPEPSLLYTTLGCEISTTLISTEVRSSLVEYGFVGDKGATSLGKLPLPFLDAPRVNLPVGQLFDRLNRALKGSDASSTSSAGALAARRPRLRTTYLDETLRVSRTDDEHYFVFRRVT